MVHYQNNREAIGKLKRCTKCLLPETFPFIQFDNEGVCNYCANYQKIELEPGEALQKAVEPHRKGGKEDCIVMFSGGRDSSFGLHYIKNKLGMNPVAFTYDWGMSTDIAVINRRRMCEELGVRQIMVEANITKKLSNIQKNIRAWLKKPELGMIPLFMAGDKQFFYYANKVAREEGLGLVFLCINPFEKTDFKTGLCGVEPEFGGERIYALTAGKKTKLLGYYFKQFVTNPAYLNSSLFNTAGAFFSFYGIEQPQLDIYRYKMWNEEEIDRVLIDRYGWETDPETCTTWRIGDGTAAFYNYIYYTVAGFTENDTFRSNQIREGIITREQGLKMIREENRPREKSIEWYLARVGLDVESTISAINAMPKLYPNE